MTPLRDLLVAQVNAKSQDDNVALLLGGLDSLTTGLALARSGKTIHAYTYEIKGYPSQERAKVEQLARHYGWKLTIITIDPSDLGSDFIRLAVEFGCKKKVQFECTYVLLHILKYVREREVWTGFNADDYFGNTRKVILQQAALQREASSDERKKQFDATVDASVAKLYDSNSGDTWWYALRVAAKYGKRLLDPYLDPSIRDYFRRFTHEQLCPPKKPVVRRAFAEELAGLPESAVPVGVRLQKGGGVHLAFRSLLSDPKINRFDRKYSTVAALCQRWGKEVGKEQDKLRSELETIAPLLQANVRTSTIGGFTRYLLSDVEKVSRAKRFTAIVTFAGGGGSSVGYQLAGAKVLITSEFVPEARRTYSANFPNCPIDARDIRELVRNYENIRLFLLEAGLEAGELDLLDGSPPCSEFSVAGNGISSPHVLRSYSDVKQRNIASLPFEFVKLAATARPKTLVMENVPAFATRGQEVFERVLDALRYIGPDRSSRRYFLNWSVLTASDFGVAQRRRRLFIIGVRADIGKALSIDSDEAVLRLFPAPTHNALSIRSALADLPQSSADIWPWITSAATTALGRSIRLLPKNPNRLTRLCDVIPGYTKQFTLTRCAWDLPAPTLVVTGQKPDGLTGAVHPEENRKFTLPELKRLFGLPDDFILTGTLAQATERVCRMVPPLLTKAIAESIYNHVLRPYAEKVK